MRTGGSGRVIGGRSLWGGLFDVLIEKYGWTFDYLVWGISYMNIQMLLADSIQTISGAEENGIAVDAMISGDDPRNMDLIRSIMNE